MFTAEPSLSLYTSQYIFSWTTPSSPSERVYFMDEPKGHYCYRIIHSLMKSNAYPPFIGNAQFYKKILIPPSMIFQKS